ASEIRVEIPEGALFPHLFCFVPAQHSMSDVIRRSDGANLPGSIPGQAAGVATIKNGEKFCSVWKGAVVAQKIVVRNSAVFRPMKIVRHEAFIDMIDFLSRVVIRQLRAMATVIKHTLVPVSRAIEQPIDPLANRCRGRALVKHDSDIFGVKPDLL